MRKEIIAAVTSLLLIQSIVYAGQFKDLAGDKVKQMLDGKKAAAVDARYEDEYRAGHIPGAINVPPDRLAAIGALLPKNRKTALIFYCRGYS